MICFIGSYPIFHCETNGKYCSEIVIFSADLKVVKYFLGGFCFRNLESLYFLFVTWGTVWYFYCMHQATTLRNMLFLHCCEFSLSLISVAVLISSSRHTSLNPSCALMVVVWKQLKCLDISDCSGRRNRFWRRYQCLSWQSVC